MTATETSINLQNGYSKCAAARVIGNTQKYDSGLSLLLHEELHWLDVVDRVCTTGVSFTTWDRSTVPDKPPHVGI